MIYSNCCSLSIQILEGEGLQKLIIELKLLLIIKQTMEHLGKNLLHTCMN